MTSIINTLEYIKENPDCDSSSLDYHQVLDLYNDEYIKGRNISTLATLQFTNLRINIQGEKYLLSLKKTIPEKDWHNKAPGKIFVGVSILVIFSVIVWIANYYFGLILN